MPLKWLSSFRQTFQTLSEMKLIEITHFLAYEVFSFRVRKTIWGKFISPLQLCAASCKAQLREDPFNRAIKTEPIFPPTLDPKETKGIYLRPKSY